jgi:acetyl esterase
MAVTVEDLTVPSGAHQLIPSVRFPIPLDDRAAAWTHLTGLGDRLFVGGASAGGTLAVTPVQRLQRAARRVPDGVVLAYPALHAELPPLTAEVRRSVRGRRRLGTFTPTLIVDSAIDTLRASGTAFAAALRARHRDVTHLVEPGTRHGHLNKNGSEGQRRTLDRMIQWLRTNR